MYAFVGEQKRNYPSQALVIMMGQLLGHPLGQLEKLTCFVEMITNNELYTPKLPPNFHVV